VADQTRLRIVKEALSGTWESLLDRRVDLLVGAAGEGPSGGGYTAEPLGTMSFVFVVAPSHPLAEVEYRLGKADLASTAPYRWRIRCACCRRAPSACCSARTR
jgi:DNA-binding transcriptional LysR family regulator